MGNDEKRALILNAIKELSDFFPIKLTDSSKIIWVEELINYSEDRILKTKKLLISSHDGFLTPKHFHEAICNFKNPMVEEPCNVENSIPMPEFFKKKYLKMRKEWDK